MNRRSTKGPASSLFAAGALLALLASACTDNDGGAPPASHPVFGGISPTTVELEAETGASAQGSVTIRNDGGAALEFELTMSATVAAWLSVAPGAGSVAPNGQRNIEVGATCPSVESELSGTIFVATNDAAADAAEIDVSLTCTDPAPPAWGASPDELVFSGVVGGAAPPSNSFTLANDGAAKGTFEIDVDAAWIAAQPDSGELDAGGELEIEVTVEACTEVGASTGELVVGGDGKASVTVTRNCEDESEAKWQVEPASLAFEGVVSEPQPDPQSFEVTNSGEDAADFEVVSNRGWLSAAPASGTLAAGAGATIEVTVDACVDTGEESGTLTVTGGGGEAHVAVTRNCADEPTPKWAAQPDALELEGVVGAEPPETKTFVLTNEGSVPGDFAIAGDEPWLNAEPSSGTLGAGDDVEVEVSADACAATGEQTASLTVSGAGAQDAQVTVTRSCTDPGGDPDVTLDLSIERFYVNQSVPAQDSAASDEQRVPIVADRSGLVRAFVYANEETEESPLVQLHYRLGNDNGHIDLDGPSSPPVGIHEGTLNDTYHTLLPGSLFKPGLEIYVIVDPDGDVAQQSTANSRYPASGYQLLEVLSVPTLDIVMVPVTYNGIPSGLSSVTAPQYLDMTARMFPLSAIDGAIRASYSFSGDLQQPEGWFALLQELTSLRNADGSSRTYYGVVNPGYTSGIAGIAWVGGPPVGAGWHHLPSGSYVAAHELGHVWGRHHAPCGTSGEPNYPYEEGRIGTWGFDLTTETLRDPDEYYDVMSYCYPQWISDYTYKGVLEYRQQSQADMQARAGSEQAASPATMLQISGLVQNGQVTLDPAFILEGSPPPVEPGPYELTGVDGEGNELFRIPFRTYEIAVDGHHAEGFNLAVAIGAEVPAQLEQLRIELGGRIVKVVERAIQVQAVVPPRATRLADGSVKVTWDVSLLAGALVRDGPGGLVLARDDTGTVRVEPTGDVIELLLSDGVQTTRKILRIEDQ